MGKILHAGKWQWKKVSFKFLFKCRQCHWWRHFWRNITSLLTEDCSRFLPPQHRTLDHRLFEDVSVAQQDPLMTQTSTWKIGDMAQGCHSDTEMPVLPAWKIFAVVHNASAAREVEAWSGHTDLHWTLVVVAAFESRLLTLSLPCYHSDFSVIDQKCSAVTENYIVQAKVKECIVTVKLFFEQ